MVARDLIARPALPPPYPAVAIGCVAVLALGLPLTCAYGGARTFGYLAGATGLAVVLVYLTVNLSAIRAFRTISAPNSGSGVPCGSR